MADATKCDACGRPLPKAKPTDDPGPRRKIFSVSVPSDEHGVLEDLCEQLVEKYQAVWGDELAPVGSRMWKYRAVHFALYAALTADLVPTEEGG